MKTNGNLKTDSLTPRARSSQPQWLVNAGGRVLYWRHSSHWSLGQMKRILRKLTVKSTSLEVYISKFWVGLLSGLIGVFANQNLEQVPESITIDCKLLHKPRFQTLRVDRWGGVTASFIRHTLQRLETVSARSVGPFPFRVSNFGSKSLQCFD